MFRRVLVLSLALMAAMSLAFATPVLAGGSGAQPSGSTSENANGDLEITLSGFQPGSTVTVSIKDANGNTIQTVTGTADANGNVTVTLKAPKSAGSFSIAGSGTGADGNPVVVAAGTVSVGGGNVTTGGGTLPRTGDDSSLNLARGGLVLVAAGGVAVFAGQKRRSKMLVDA